ncbi:hypothetical protein [Sphingomonas prati]|uniref:Uncharacterized protein n=1 Tax=Sphingomonas prati TaxID=1843237 RepID=A0A7W9F2K9_9SPHN|nr:hypothetical protein [Sphingomonas prati]MBB5730426.1 hypothetical protein [Sphingomonas prati]GGE93993.1 hypothetical protein GCM10011404_28790 [Sphingomonas prati]
MTAPVPVPVPQPGHAAPDAQTPLPARHDGWTPARQRRFLEAIADGATVEDAARAVGLTATAAYSFRRRAPGAAFALGWAAANLHARERLADTLVTRALEGQVETITRPDGSVIERHRYDNRLGLMMLARLDRQAAADIPASATAAGGPTSMPSAARTVAAGFDAYLDLIAADAGPARAALFLAAAPSQDTPAAPLAHADRWLHADTAPDLVMAADHARAEPEEPVPSIATPSTDEPEAAPTPNRHSGESRDLPVAGADPLPKGVPGLRRDDAQGDRDDAGAEPDDAAGQQATTMPPTEQNQTPANTATSSTSPTRGVPLHPDYRAHWTAEDWARAEAAGLLILAVPVPPACPIAAADGVAGRAFGLGTETVSELMGSLSGRTQLLSRALARLGDRDPDEPRAPPPEYAPDPLVWREEGGTWRTAFPPPPGFMGEEQCDYGDEDYARTLTPDEQDIAEAFELRHPARVAHAAERDA